MGDAKRRLDELGTTREIHFDGRELTDLLNWLLTDARKERDKSRKLSVDKRRAFRSALRQMGILEIYQRARKGTLKPGETPEGGVKTMTVDAIDTMLAHLAVEMDHAETLDIGELEERMQDAKAGVYEPPPADAPAAPDKPAEPEPAAAAAE